MAYYVSISIDHTKVGGSTLTNFPVFVSISAATLKDVAHSGHVQSSSGYDIIFATDSLGSFKIPWEIESYDPVNGILIAWVKIPTVSYTVDTVFYVLYGDAKASVPQNTGDCTPTNVWDANFKGVWHLGDGATLGLSDSVGAHNLTNVRTVGATSGKVSGAGSFPGTDPFASAVYLKTSAPATTSVVDITMSAWVYTTDNSKSGQMVIHNGSDVNNNGYGFAVNNESVSNGHFYILWAGIVWGDAGQVVPSNAWHHLAVVWSSDGKSAIPYYDGSALTTKTASVAAVTPTLYTTIGVNDVTSAARNFKGKIDEVHVSNVQRSAGWILAEYNNQNDPSTFVSLGTETAVTPAFAYRRSITIDHTKTGSVDLTDFPVFVSISDATFKDSAHSGHVLNSSGYDIAFASDSAGASLIPWEVEAYDPVNGILVAWAKISTVSHTTDTTFYVLYSAAYYAPQNTGSLAPANVWDSNYKAVWHLGDGTTLNGRDSTSNSNHESIVGSPAVAVGKIDGSAYFDGADSKYLTLASPPSSSMNFGTGNLTISAWIYPTVAPSSDNYCILDTLLVGNLGQRLNALFFGVKTDGHLFVFSSNSYRTSAAASPAVNTWTHVVLQRVSNTWSYYVNGSVDANSYSQSITMSDGGATIGVSADSSFPTTGGRFVGRLDEIRTSSIARSVDWMLTEYNNQNVPGTFFALGSEMAAGVSAGFMRIRFDISGGFDA